MHSYWFTEDMGTIIFVRKAAPALPFLFGANRPLHLDLHAKALHFLVYLCISWTHLRKEQVKRIVFSFSRVCEGRSGAWSATLHLFFNGAKMAFENAPPSFKTHVLKVNFKTEYILKKKNVLKG